MSKYVLTCDCGCTDFAYDNDSKFTCHECETTYDIDNAGHELLAE